MEMRRKQSEKSLIEILCEECDKNKANLFCRQCDQRICETCDKRIHNKGKRALHQRVPLEVEKRSLSLGSDLRTKLASTEAYTSENLMITYTQMLNIGKNQTKLEKLKRVTADYYIENADEGILMHDLHHFKTNLYARFQDEFGPRPKPELENLFQKMKNEQFLHITVRKFGDTKALKYASLCFKCISVEAIIWLMKSIEKDKMKPTEKLVLSRIKEYFLLKISLRDWNTAVEFFYKNPQSLTRFSEYLPRIIIKKIEKKGMKEFQNKTSFSYNFTIEDLIWDWEDCGEIDENCSDWMNFKKYIDKFFEEDVAKKKVDDNRMSRRKKKNTKNIKKWLSSVENNLSKTSNSLMVNENLQKVLMDQSISKAIPGGKYGCALMIKLRGPYELKDLSLGKLCAFVQHALNSNLLIYYKTLLIKNNQYNSKENSKKLEKKNKKKIDEAKKSIVELLKNHKTGLSLAQIPILVKKKFNKTYNIQALGFPKLKNLLADMPEIRLERAHGNFLKATLKTHIRNSSERELEKKKNNKLAGMRFHTLKTNPLDLKLNNAFYGNISQLLSEGNIISPPMRVYRTVSTLEDYIIKVQSIIVEILRENLYGIEVEKLEKSLNNRLGAEFDSRICKVDTFQEFLVSYLDDYLDIELKKSLRPKKNKPLTYIVYPKNYKIPYPAKLPSYHYHQQQGHENRFYKKNRKQEEIEEREKIKSNIFENFDQNLSNFSRNSFNNFPLSNGNNSIMNNFHNLYKHFNDTKALSFTSARSTDMIKRKKVPRQEAQPDNLSQAPPSNSTKSSRRRAKEYSPFGGLEIQGLNLNFKPRPLRKKEMKNNKEKKITSQHYELQRQIQKRRMAEGRRYDDTFDYQVISPLGSDGSNFEYEMKEDADMSFESFDDAASFKLVEQLLDEE